MDKLHVGAVVWIICYLFIIEASSTEDTCDTDTICCKATGTRNIIVNWKAIESRNVSYEVYYCKYPDPCRNKTKFHLGCTSNRRPKNGYQNCDMGNAINLDFPTETSFNYFIKANVGGKIHGANISHCQLSLEMKCIKLRDVTLQPINKRILKLSWERVSDMGGKSASLCYKIHYASELDVRNRTEKHYIDDYYSFTFSPTLLPYTEYKVYIQCSLNCEGGWGELTGPVTARTLEEAPRLPVAFISLEQHLINDNERNVSVTLKFPRRETWNGVVRNIKLTHWKGNSTTNSSVTMANFTGLSKESVYLPPLMRFKQYTVQAEFCTSAGCSPPSNNLTIPSQHKGKVANQPQPNFNFNPTWIYALVGVFMVLSLTMIVSCLICRVKRPVARDLNEAVGPLPLYGTDREDLQHEEANDNEYSYALSPRSVQHQSVHNTETSSFSSRRTGGTLNPDTHDFTSASDRTLNSAFSLPCMASTNMVEINLNNTEEEVLVPHCMIHL